MKTNLSKEELYEIIYHIATEIAGCYLRKECPTTEETVYTDTSHIPDAYHITSQIIGCYPERVGECPEFDRLYDTIAGIMQYYLN